MGVHRKKAKVKEMIRLGVDIPFLTKEKEFGLQRAVHRGEVTRSTWGNQGKGRAVLIRTLCKLSWC